jgi:hypothetical protein
MRKSDEIIMETFHIWQAEDGIRTVIDACLGCGIWEMTYDNADSTIRAELNEHLTEMQANDLCSQFNLYGYYDGEGEHGSIFIFQYDNADR